MVQSEVVPVAGPWTVPVARGRTLTEVADRVHGSLDPAWAGRTVTGVAQDSRSVRPGDLYVALPGAHAHGASFAAQAVARGAVAVLLEPSALPLLAPSLLVPPLLAPPLVSTPRDPAVPLVTATGLRAALGPLASWVHGDPSRSMDLIGVTGTNGKTSTTYLLHAGMVADGRAAGLLSGVQIRGPGGSRVAVRTTPEATDLQGWLACLARQGATAAAVEVSSHGLALHRVDGTVFRAAVFTNLGRDHLDLHGDMGTYLDAKARLFEPGRCGVAVVGVDGVWGRRLVSRLRVPVVTFGGAGSGADWRVRDVVATAAGTAFGLLGPGVDTRVRLGLLGAHQADNAAAAIAALVSTGTDPAAAVRGVESVAGVPGRLERVDVGQSFTAFVDYVHNESGQARVFPWLRSLGTGRLLVVMGATGERDLGKRAPLGRAAGAAADLVVVTDESPHSEDPAAVREAVAAGAAAGGRATVLVEADRAAAFDLAVSLARPGDVLVVCGRGHDPLQVSAAGSRRFEDRVELRAALDRRYAPGAAGLSTAAASRR